MTSHAVVLLHALPLSAAMWAEPRRALERLGHHVIAPDQRGFGKKPLGEGPPSLDLVADDLAALLDERRIKKALIAGSSMGGYVAMAFLRRHPHRVAGLALLAARASADDEGARAGRERFARLIRDEAYRESLIASTARSLVGATTERKRPDILAHIFADAKAADPTAVAWAQQAIAARPDSLGLLREADVPALVVAGAEDRLVSIDEARAAAEALPRGRLIVIEGAGHLLPLEAPGPVVDALLGLVADVTAPGEGGAGQ